MIKKSTLRQELLYFLCQIRLLAKKSKWREGDFLVFQYDTLHQIDKRNSTCNIYVLETDRKKYYFRVCHRSFRSKGFFSRIWKVQLTIILLVFVTMSIKYSVNLKTDGCSYIWDS